jgi:hypothetical protein
MKNKGDELIEEMYFKWLETPGTTLSPETCKAQEERARVIDDIRHKISPEDFSALEDTAGQVVAMETLDAYKQGFKDAAAILFSLAKAG